jgi:hypothetical protein
MRRFEPLFASMSFPRRRESRFPHHEGLEEREELHERFQPETGNS